MAELRTTPSRASPPAGEVLAGANLPAGTGWWRGGLRPQGRCPPAQPHRVLRKVRLPGLGLHHRECRAAAVQLQRAARGLPGLRRAGREAAVRRAAGGAQRSAQPQAGRGRALGQVEPAAPLLHAGAGEPGQAYRLRARHAVEGAAGRGAAGDPARHRGQGGRR